MSLTRDALGDELKIPNGKETVHRVLVILTCITGVYNVMSYVANVIIFVRRRKMPYFEQRGRALTYLLLLISGLFCFICAPLCIFSLQLNLIDWDLRITMLIICVIFHMVLMVHSLRFWFIFLKIRRAQESASWKLLLNPDYQSWVIK